MLNASSQQADVRHRKTNAHSHTRKEWAGDSPLRVVRRVHDATLPCPAGSTDRENFSPQCEHLSFAFETIPSAEAVCHRLRNLQESPSGVGKRGRFSIDQAQFAM